VPNIPYHHSACWLGWRPTVTGLGSYLLKDALIKLRAHAAAEVAEGGFAVVELSAEQMKLLDGASQIELGFRQSM
jgi:hypothetical protein